MRPPHFVDLDEAAPGEWCVRGDRDRVRAARPAIGEDKRRRRTLEDIPNAGSPAQFWAAIACIAALKLLFG